MKKAIVRGAEIDIYVDPLLNADPNPDGKSNLELAEAQLLPIGVQLRKLPQLHSKIVAVDVQQLCISSYNWLSAQRDGRYTRHETSFVYQGAHVEQEINTIRGSLTNRSK